MQTKSYIQHVYKVSFTYIIVFHLNEYAITKLLYSIINRCDYKHFVTKKKHDRIRNVGLHWPQLEKPAFQKILHAKFLCASQGVTFYGRIPKGACNAEARKTVGL